MDESTSSDEEPEESDVELDMEGMRVFFNAKVVYINEYNA